MDIGGFGEIVRLGTMITVGSITRRFRGGTYIAARYIFNVLGAEVVARLVISFSRFVVESILRS